MEENRLMQQGVDSRAMFAVYITKLPQLLILAVAGAILGSGLNFLIVLGKTREICYVSETEYYIEFAEGRYEARDYYNAFTWNDVLTTDLILGKAMEELGDGYDREQVKTMITAEMLSDVRYLTVFVRGQVPEQVEAIKNALGTALEEFAAEKRELFDSIYQIEDLKIVQERISYFGWRAAFLGAAVAVAVGAFVTAFCFCMGSVFYTKRDITVRLGLPVCGMTFRKKHRRKRVSALEQRQAKMLGESLRRLSERYPQILLMDASDGQDASMFLQDIRGGELAGGSCFQICGVEKQTVQDAAIVAVIPFGRTYRERIMDEIEYAEQCGGRVVAAVLTQADRVWTEIYYAQGFYRGK